MLGLISSLCTVLSSAWKFPRKYSQRQVSGYLSALCVTHGNCTRRYFRCCPNRAESLKEIFLSLYDAECHMSDTYIHKFNIKCWALIPSHRQNSYEDLLLEIPTFRRVQVSRCLMGDRPLLGPFCLQSSTKEGLCNPESSGNESQGFPFFRGSYARIIIMPQRPIQISAQTLHSQFQIQKAV